MSGLKDKKEKKKTKQNRKGHSYLGIIDKRAAVKDNNTAKMQE